MGANSFLLEQTLFGMGFYQVYRVALRKSVIVWSQDLKHKQKQQPTKSDILVFLPIISNAFVKSVACEIFNGNRLCIIIAFPKYRHMKCEMRNACVQLYILPVLDSFNPQAR